MTCGVATMVEDRDPPGRQLFDPDVQQPRPVDLPRERQVCSQQAGAVADRRPRVQYLCVRLLPTARTFWSSSENSELLSSGTSAM